MNFLKECASRLDAGESADTVLSSMKERFTTSRCLNVKTCLVRSMCRVSQDYSEALERECAAHPEWEKCIRSGRCDGDKEILEILRSLPPRLPENVRSLRVTRREMHECKRLGFQSALKKNLVRTKVHGRNLLSHARGVLASPEKRTLSDLALSLMLLTGRRTCEIMNGRSVFSELDESRTESALLFRGQAKRRTATDSSKDEDSNCMMIPVLAPTSQIMMGLSILRDRQGHTKLSNDAASRRYQSLLARNMQAHQVWKQCKKVHGLRGVYTCICLRLFTWNEDLTESVISMCILGHTGLTDSLVYMTFHLGDHFREEDMLGPGMLTEPPGFGDSLQF